MNSVDVYKDIDNRDERMTLAKCERNNIHIYMGNDIIDWEINRLEKEIIKLKEAKGVTEHLRMRGWEIFDISDDITFDETYLPFVGTRKELFERVPNPSAYSEELCGF